MIIVVVILLKRINNGNGLANNYRTDDVSAEMQQDTATNSNLRALSYNSEENFVFIPNVPGKKRVEEKKYKSFSIF